MRNLLVFLTTLGLLLVTAGSSSADVLFADYFDSEPGGLNYDSFLNWDVVDGTVDSIGDPFGFDWWPNGGMYVDMDGSSDPATAGTIVTKQAITLAPGSYVLCFDLAGNYWMPDEQDTIIAAVTEAEFQTAESTPVIAGDEFALPYDQGWTEFELFFDIDTETDVYIVFSGTGDDTRGMLLDNVDLSTVPAPGAVLLGGIGAACVGSLRRRRAL